MSPSWRHIGMQDLTLPHNITATTSMAEAISGARYAIHALPVQHSRAFLTAIKVTPPPLGHSVLSSQHSQFEFVFVGYQWKSARFVNAFMQRLCAC